jgi:hypothetical protein
MTLAWSLLGLLAVAIIYWFGLRPWLRSVPALAGVWERLDKVEAVLWQRSRTLLAAKLLWIPSALIAAHDFIAAVAVDWTPLTQRFLDLFPAPYRPLVLPVALALVGKLFAWLRTLTTKPLSEKGPE